MLLTRAPGLDFLTAPDAGSTLVLFAPGGDEESQRAPARFDVAAARMWPWAVAARRELHGLQVPATLAVLRYRVTGWNGPNMDAATDLAAALDDVGPGHSRVLLVGHSMGGRAIVAAGNHPEVAGVLGFAPWLPGDEPLIDLAGRTVVFAHGTLDRWTDPRTTKAYAQALREQGIGVATIGIDGDGHTLLRRWADTNDLVARFVRRAVGAPESYLDEVISTDPDRPIDYLPRWRHGRLGMAGGVVDSVRSRLRLPIRDHHDL